MRLILLFCIALFAPTRLWAAPPIAVEMKTPPPFGYRVGSIITHQADLFVPAPWQLDIAQLPASGPIDDWLEIRALTHETHSQNAGIRYRLQIEYQIFPSIKNTASLEIPSFPLPLITPEGKREASALPAWKFTVNPLIPPKRIDTRAEIRPLWQPQPVDLAPYWRRLASIAVGLLLAGVAWAWYRRRLPWQRPPFTRALPQIRRAVRRQQMETALQIFHQALNATAQRALFPAQLADFLRRRPAFAPLKDDLERFFDTSQHFFFGHHSNLNPARLTELERLCRNCAKAETRRTEQEKR
ncbi:hypothetical protein [Methylohalobius crimeensis]|uniref:hypothetical protein n=1 Tax=Methylohalobius crimeensis TaxID=244365 RepID=UPI0003B53E2A|nr:hypothetical protein [Methylohalobius crimeensis]